MSAEAEVVVVLLVVVMMPRKTEEGEKSRVLLFTKSGAVPVTETGGDDKIGGPRLVIRLRGDPINSTATAGADDEEEMLIDDEEESHDDITT